MPSKVLIYDAPEAGETSVDGLPGRPSRVSPGGDSAGARADVGAPALEGGPLAAELPLEPPPLGKTAKKPGEKAPFVFNPLAPYKGLVQRFLLVCRHVLGLMAGGLLAYRRTLPPERTRGLRSPGTRLASAIVRPFVSRRLRRLPFPVQLRRRLEILGPTYVKLGQILAIREDILPRPVTSELANLLDRLPEIPFEQVEAIIERSLGRPLTLLFAEMDPRPLGSASIAQAHRARLFTGEAVVVKVIKPGIREAITSDLKLLELVGHFLQWTIPRYQPRQLISEFATYTLRELDYLFEAENAEVFALNFRDEPDIVFPQIYRDLSSLDVLTMAFLDGFKPGSPQTWGLAERERQRVIELGAASVIQMLYRDGFFHADLHAGNLLILPPDEASGRPVRLGFIDLGMVGRFERKMKRQLLYYFYALVSGDVEGATRYLLAMASVDAGGDVQGFRRAVQDLSRRFLTYAPQGGFSIAQLVLESLALGGRFRIFFPVEMTLMVKALVTFEGVGRMLDPDLDVPATSRKYVTQVFRETFDPAKLSRELLRSAPEMVDLAVRLPQLLAEGFRAAEEALQDHTRRNPIEGLRSGVVAGACIIGAVLAVVGGGPVLLWLALFAAGLLLFLLGD